MIIGLITFEIYLPYAHSLKEKRQVINKLKDKIKPKFNVSFAELDFVDKWQITKIGLVAINNQKATIEKMFHKILKEIENNLDGQLINFRIEYI
ncbi:MAG: DUF503 domain-containing protein [Candidatus Aminicenantia bacterium]